MGGKLNVIIIILILVILTACLAGYYFYLKLGHEKSEIGIDIETKPRPVINEKIVVFHNGRGSMCLEFLDFIKDLNYPVEQHLVGEDSFSDILSSYIYKYGQSEGVSDNFGYYPIIFIKEKAYSGFNGEIKNKILEDIK
ncbi:hypothetical protein JW977_01860 [Candidatus Falkowbacteria bacterium]|nr:hypothetical protein [Candidatus Falkowbacteria bacterium]